MAAEGPLVPAPLPPFPLFPLLLAAAAAALFSYYWARVPRRPLLAAGPRLRVFLERHCPAVGETFCPTPWCFEGRLQTVLGALLQARPPVSYRSEAIRTPDGGQLILDWAENTDSHRHPEPHACPTVLLLPGLTGTSQAGYLLRLVHRASCAGYRHPGHSAPATRKTWRQPSPTSSANTRVPQYWLWASPWAGMGRVHAADELGWQHGWLSPGMGQDGGTAVPGQEQTRMAVWLCLTRNRMQVLNYLGRRGQAAGLVAAMALSPVWDPSISSTSLEQPLNALLFNQHLAVSLCRLVSRHRVAIGEKVDMEHVLKARTIREFDERYTAPAFGYRSCHEYYEAASPKRQLHHIRVPVLCLNASDDPFSPLQAIPVETAWHLSYVALLVTAHGGHIGFLEGFWPRPGSFMERLFSQFITAVFEHGDEVRQLEGDREGMKEGVVEQGTT